MAHVYLRKVGVTEAVDDKFVQYVVDEAPSKLMPAGGKSSSEKLRLLRGRVLLKKASAERAAVKEEKMLAGRRADELILSFIGAIEAEGGLKSEGESAAMDEDDASDA